MSAVRNGIGAVMDETDPASIAAAIDQVYAERERLRPTGERLLRLRERCTWEPQSRKLRRVYAAVLGDPARH